MKIGYFVALAATAVGAGVAGWYASKVYYDKKAQKVVEMGRDPIREDPKEETKEPEKVDIPKDRELFPSSFASPEEKMAHFNSIRDIYHQTLDKHNYTSPEEIKDPANQAPIEKSDEPYVVASEAWGEVNGYDKIDLVYYEQDGIVADYDNNIYSIEEIGDEFQENFDENDVVHVRNDSYSRDYEIVLDPRSFREVATGEP